MKFCDSKRRLAGVLVQKQDSSGVWTVVNRRQTGKGIVESCMLNNRLGYVINRDNVLYYECGLTEEFAFLDVDHID